MSAPEPETRTIHSAVMRLSMIHPAKNPQPNGFDLATFAPSLDGQAGESLGSFLQEFEDPMCDECDPGVSESDLMDRLKEALDQRDEARDECTRKGKMITAQQGLRESLQNRVNQLEAIVLRMLRAEPERHKESMSYENPHTKDCIWCEARRALNP